MWMYYLELHKLEVKDATLELTERNPIKPMARNQTLHMGNMSHYQTFTPLEPGMYSILLEVRDIANNSRIARRFVLYDKVSDVELNQESPNGLHVSSAQNHTGFKWQSAGSEGQSTNIVVNWARYFMNKAHEDGHYNNEIQTFKPQFEDLEDDGILYTRKFVNASLDDMEGARTRDPIANIHGIVKFEYQYTRDIGSQIPGAVWTKVEPITETTTIKEQMSSGDQLKIWVRAQDVLGNTKMDSTVVTTDFTEPITSSADDNTTTYIVENTNVKPFNYSSSVYLEAYDTESGVRDIGVNITIKMQGVSNIYVSKMAKANTDDKRHPDRDSECVTSRDKTTCFLKKQTVIIDNCWLTVPNQALLPSASAIIDVIAYNQAMLASSVRFEVIYDLFILNGRIDNDKSSPSPTCKGTNEGENIEDNSIDSETVIEVNEEINTEITDEEIKKAVKLLKNNKSPGYSQGNNRALDGLVSYNGPESARVENVKTGSFRIVWDFPTNLSCYAIQTSIIIVLFKKASNGNIELETHVIPGSNTYFDVVNLDADTEYLLDFITQIGDKKNPPMKLTARTLIDKCTANTDNCDDTNGGCTNTAGSFTCSCNTGFNLEADGFTCTDIDECTANTDNCDDTNGGCTNTAGSFTCSCNAGYNLEADGFTCTDIDECSTYTNICGPSDGLCTNTDGSYTCSCNTGYILHNNSCTVPPETPRGFTIDCIQHNKARLSWLPGNNGGLTQTFVIQLGTGESSWEDTEVQDGVKQNDQPISKILTGLGDSTTYFVRMYAYNKVGKSPLSEILIFTTSPIKVETETTTTLIVGIVLSVVIVVVISYAIYVTIRLKRNISFKKGGRAQEKGDQVNIHIEDSTNIPDSGGYDNPYTDLRTEMRDSGSPYQAISTM
ncbi:uncharacterized protein LOC132722945 [Ruditapes philippinarum]|uniref:uncharacterized protein LOC132722945 n=1 Tax=Ruditapes philippinarum TaxID=129788 RepID=UPI00295BE5B1|nr:uncharacterized protein LOC132722945 [Ruditapes philippinarum]